MAVEKEAAEKCATELEEPASKLECEVRAAPSLDALLLPAEQLGVQLTGALQVARMQLQMNHWLHLGP